MKKLIGIAVSLLFFIFISAEFLYSKTDTTFTNDLNVDGTPDKISLNSNQDDGTYTLKVNNEKFIYFPETLEDIYAGVVRLNYKKYLVVCNNAYYGYETVIFEYGTKLDSIGMFWSMDFPEFEERGVIKVSNWMGFWSAAYEYHIENNKLIPVYEKEYAIPESVNENVMKTTETISLKESKQEKSKTAYEIKKGTRIYILKADISNKCKTDDTYEDACNWYYFKSSDGKAGWIMLKDFQDKVEGIPWAG